jgi:hypothetical protein
MEKGLNHRYTKNYFEQTIVKCPKTKRRYSDDVGLRDVLTAFAILAVGTLLASIVLALEAYLNCRSNKRTAKTTYS